MSLMSTHLLHVFHSTFSFPRGLVEADGVHGIPTIPLCTQPLGASKCSACPAGSYSVSTGTSVCDKCLVGLSCPSSSTTSTAYVLCGKGKYSAPGTVCLSCQAGTHTSSVGMWMSECAVCDPSTFSSAGSVTCSDCDAGKYSLPVLARENPTHFLISLYDQCVERKQCPTSSTYCRSTISNETEFLSMHAGRPLKNYVNKRGFYQIFQYLFLRQCSFRCFRSHSGGLMPVMLSCMEFRILINIRHVGTMGSSSKSMNGRDGTDKVLTEPSTEGSHCEKKNTQAKIGPSMPVACQMGWNSSYCGLGVRVHRHAQ